MKQIDKEAIFKYGMPSIALMENAGRAVADCVVSCMKHKRGLIAIFCGKGNNGGDGFVCARRLAANGYKVCVYLLSGSGEIKPDAAINFNILSKMRQDIIQIKDIEAFEKIKKKFKAGIIVDAIFGTGFRGKPDSKTSAVIGYINEFNAKVISVDVPSGLNATSGSSCGVFVKADKTVALGLGKKGFYKNKGPIACGKIIIADIGLPNVRNGARRCEPRRGEAASKMGLLPRFRGNSLRFLAMTCVITFFSLLSVACFAMPVNGVIFPEKGRWETGVETNMLFEKQMKRPKGDIKSRQYFNKLSFAPFDWLSLDFRLGWGNIKFSPADAKTINYNTAFAGGYGFRARLTEPGAHLLDLIYGFGHISVHPDPRKVNGVKNEICMDDWQASLILTKQFKFFYPYAGIKYSKVVLTRITSHVPERKKSGSVDRVGLAVGMDFTYGKNIAANIEGRFFDEEGLNINLSWLF